MSLQSSCLQGLHASEGLTGAEGVTSVLEFQIGWFQVGWNCGCWKKPSVLQYGGLWLVPEQIIKKRERAGARVWCLL